MKRYQVRIIGPSTHDRWCTVAERQTWHAAHRQFLHYCESHGKEHGVILIDNKRPSKQSVVLKDLTGATMKW